MVDHQQIIAAGRREATGSPWSSSARHSLSAGQTVIVNNDDLLFASGLLSEALRAQISKAEEAVDGWDRAELLNTPEHEIVAYLLAEYGVACPVLHRDQAEQEEVSEEVVPGRGMFTGRPISQRLTKIVVAVPFDGDAAAFRLQPSNFTLNPPRARVDTVRGELRLIWLGDPQAGLDSAAVRQFFDTQLDSIERYLRSSQADIDGHNARLRSQVEGRIAQRKQRLLADQQLAAGLGFKTRQGGDAATHIIRRRIETTRRPGPGNAIAEPVMAEAQYEDALAVLRHARNVIERAPSLTASMTEERIRDLLLMFLNAVFEGAAAGEVFNANGKTDILIRVEDRNVFIAECKIWAGPAKFRDAIDQLLSYLTWRDTKAALILFIRTGRTSEVIAKAVAEIEGHPNFKMASATSNDCERHDFVLHTASDPDRQIRLALLPFALQVPLGY
jgi:hypothetical protein